MREARIQRRLPAGRTPPRVKGADSACRLQIAHIDHHADLVSAVGQSISGLKRLYLCGVVAVGEADDCADGHLISHILLGPLHEGWGCTQRPCRSERRRHSSP